MLECPEYAWGCNQCINALIRLQVDPCMRGGVLGIEHASLYMLWLKPLLSVVLASECEGSQPCRFEWIQIARAQKDPIVSG